MKTSAIVKNFVWLIKNGKMTIDDVKDPLIKADVKEQIDKKEGGSTN